MRSNNNGFKSFEQFHTEVLKHRAGPLSSAVDDIAEELYHTEIVDEFDALWDKADED